MPVYFRSDQGRVQITVEGVVLDSVSWDSMSGGDVMADSNNYPPGGMQPTIELGGTAKRSNIVVERIWSDTLLGVFKALDAAAGDATATMGYTVLRKGQPVTNGSITYSGLLLGVARPGYDSTSTAPAKLQLTFGCHRVLT